MESRKVPAVISNWNGKIRTRYLVLIFPFQFDITAGTLRLSIPLAPILSIFDLYGIFHIDVGS
jgi:hypothetical protein